MPLILIIEVIKDIAKYGPEAVDAGKKIVALIRNGPHPLTAADIALLDSFDESIEQELAEAGGAPAAPLPSQ